MTTSQLHSLLRAVRNQAGRSFSGVGLLVSTASDNLPICPLRPNQVVPDGGSTLDILASISQQTSDLHDGFHLLSPKLHLMLVSLYFSPPIAHEITFDSRRGIGERYMAALFGSTLPSIIATGVASPRYGIAVFHRGKEVSAEP